MASHVSPGGGCWSLLRSAISAHPYCSLEHLCACRSAINQASTTMCVHLLSPHAQLNHKWKLKVSAKCKQCSWESPGAKEKHKPWMAKASWWSNPFLQTLIRKSGAPLIALISGWALETRDKSSSDWKRSKSGCPKLQAAFLLAHPPQSVTAASGAAS